MTKFTDAVGAEGLRREVWLDALVRHRGSLTEAAVEFGFSRQRACNLNRQYGLTDDARRLRAEARAAREAAKQGKKSKKAPKST